MNLQDTLQTLFAYDTVADVLSKSGVEIIFGVMGEDTAPLVVAAVARGIAYRAARHENQAVAMADGYSRATGRIGVATVTGGPGFSNALTAINTAHRAGSHIVVLTGAGRAEEDDHAPEVVRQANGASWLKYLPQSAVLEVLGIPTAKPLRAEEAAGAAMRAMELASQGTAILVLGRGLLLTKMVAGTAGESGPHAGTSPGKPKSTAAVPAEKIGELADLLQETWAVKQPLILAGRGAATAGAGPALRRLAELTGGLLATSLRARGLFRGDPYDIGVCGTYSTPVASTLITQTDCVLAFGATLNPWTTYRNSLFPKALLVQIDTNEAALGRFLPAALSIAGDSKQVAEALVAELERRGHAASGGRSEATRRDIAAFRKEEGFVDRSTDTLIDPGSLMLGLDRILPPGRILCVDGGQQARFAIRYIDTERPENVMQSVDGGAIGLGIGTAIGAAVGRPGNVVVLAVGDGGIMMSLGDIDSAIRFRLPMLVVVSNDESFGAEVNVLSDLGLPTQLADTPCPSFEAMARAMGAQAATVRRVADLAVVEEWLRNGSDGPLVLDCRVNPQVRAE